MSYLKEFNHLRAQAFQHGLIVRFVGAKRLQDFIGMNPRAAKAFGYKMPSNEVHLVRGMSDRDKLDTLMHELIEFADMEEHHKHLYWSAHIRARKRQGRAIGAEVLKRINI